MKTGPSVSELIKSDLYRYNAKVSFLSFLRNIILNRSFKYMFFFRLAKSNIRGVRFVAKIVHHRLSMCYGIQIPLQVEIGYGLYIGHHMGVVINPTVRIGDNCNLSQFTTIGSNHNAGAVIGSNVYIGPSVCIVEAIHVGDGVTIGAGAVVTRNVPENATVAGVPAKIISYKEPGRYIHNKWIYCNGGSSAFVPTASGK